ncbi:MAG: hypothetical protein KJO20_04020 [Eudoraea sp.]|nr:hypothetical protein [Eudoraea sp.]NNK30999.1 hypothetical protein [Flavobacteriaceae bacterium]
MILVFPFIFNKNYVGISLWPFILLKEIQLKEDARLINHERIHLRQQIEMLIFPFYLWYVLEWGIRFIRCGDAKKAYRNLSFEREAYQQEDNLNYLKNRAPFRFIRYLSPF